MGKATRNTNSNPYALNADDNKFLSGTPQTAQQPAQGNQFALGADDNQFVKKKVDGQDLGTSSPVPAPSNSAPTESPLPTNASASPAGISTNDQPGADYVTALQDYGGKRLSADDIAALPGAANNPHLQDEENKKLYVAVHNTPTVQDISNKVGSYLNFYIPNIDASLVDKTSFSETPQQLQDRALSYQPNRTDQKNTIGPPPVVNQLQQQREQQRQRADLVSKVKQGDLDGIAAFRTGVNQHLQKQISDIENNPAEVTFDSTPNAYGTVNSRPALSVAQKNQIKILKQQQDNFNASIDAYANIALVKSASNKPGGIFNTDNVIELGRQKRKITGGINALSEDYDEQLVKDNNARTNVNYINEASGLEAIRNVQVVQHANDIKNYMETGDDEWRRLASVTGSLLNETQTKIDNLSDKYAPVKVSHVARLMGEYISKQHPVMNMFITDGDRQTAIENIEKDYPGFSKKYAQEIAFINNNGGIETLIPHQGFIGAFNRGGVGGVQDILNSAKDLFGVRSRGDRAADRVNAMTDAYMMGTAQAGGGKVVLNKDGLTFQQRDDENYTPTMFNSAMNNMGHFVGGVVPFVATAELGGEGVGALVKTYGKVADIASGVTKARRLQQLADFGDTDVLGMENVLDQTTRPLLSASKKQFFGNVLSNYAMNFDNNLSAAEHLVSDKSGAGDAKKAFIANLLTWGQIAAFSKLPQTKIAQQLFSEGLQRDAGKLLADLGTENILSAASKDGLTNWAKNYVVPRIMATTEALKKSGATIAKGTGEMVLMNHLNAGISNMFDETGATNDHSVWDEDIRTVKDMGLGLAGMAGIGLVARGAGKAVAGAFTNEGGIPNAFRQAFPMTTRDALYEAATNSDQNIQRINANISNGTMPKEEGNAAIKMIRTAAELYPLVEKAESQGLAKTTKQKAQLLAEMVRLRYLNHAETLPGVKELIDEAQGNIDEINADNRYNQVQPIHNIAGDVIGHERVQQPPADVKKNNPFAPQIGDEIQWNSQGADQFEEPKKITHITEDGTHVFVEGSDTGIPIHQVTVVKQNEGQPESKATPNKEQPAENVSQTEIAPEQKDENVSIAEMLDSPITYKGKKARLLQDGQTVIAKIEGQPREYEIGNINDIKDHPIKDYGIEQQQSVVGVNDDGDITVRGEVFKNNYSKPTAAINHNEDGDVISVNLETPDGKKRTFRGDIAEDIAYQIHLKELTKDDGTRKQFEQFINNDESAREAINAARPADVAEAGTNKDNEQVPAKPERQTAERKQRIKKNETIKVSQPAESENVAEKKPDNNNEKPFVNEGDYWTHLTNSDEAIRQLLQTGKFIGKGENLENFTKEVSQKRFNLEHQNALSPYFQKGKFYGEPTQKYLIATKGDEKFTPNINHANAENFEQSKGVGVLNPENRDAKDLEIYKKADDGNYYKLTDEDINELISKNTEHATTKSEGAQQKSPAESSNSKHEGTKQPGSKKEAAQPTGSNSAERSQRGQEKEITEEDIKQAESAHEAAKKALNEAERGVAGTQATQAGMFGGEQKGMFAMGRDEAKETLDPLRKKVKETKAALDDIKNRFEVQKLKETPDLFEKEKGKTVLGLKRAEAKKTYDLVRHMDEPTDARGMAMEYFANGGKVDQSEISKEVAGRTRASLNTGAREKRTEEEKSRDYTDKSGKTFNDIAHSLWDNLPEYLQDSISTEDLRNELIDVANSFNTRLDVAKAYVDSHGSEMIEGRMFSDEELAHFQAMHAEEIAAEEREMQSWDAERWQEEQSITQSDEYINHLIDQYERENSAADNEIVAKSEGEANQAAGNGESSPGQDRTEESQPFTAEGLTEDDHKELDAALQGHGITVDDIVNYENDVRASTGQTVPNNQELSKESDQAGKDTGEFQAPVSEPGNESTGSEQQNSGGEAVENTKNENSKPVSDREKEIRQKIRDNKDAFRAALRKSRGQANSGIDPEVLAAGAKLLASYTELGFFKFGEIVKDVMRSFGKDFFDKENTDTLMQVYNDARENADPEKTKEFNTAEEVRKFVEEELPGMQDTTSFQHSATQEKREELGLGDRRRRIRKSDKTLDQEADEAIKNGFDVNGLMEDIESNYVPNDVERTILSKYGAKLESELEKISTESPDFNKKLAEIKRVYDAAEKAGSEAGAALRVVQNPVVKDNSLAGFFVREMDVRNTDELLEKDKAVVKEEWEKINAKKAELDAREAAIKEQEKQAAANKEVEEAKKTAGKKGKKSHDDFVKERKDILKDMRDDLLKVAKGGGGSLSTIPGLPQLQAMAPHVLRLMKSLVEEGVNKLDDIVSQIHDNIKDYGVTKDQVHDMIAGEYNASGTTRNDIQRQLYDLRAEAKLNNKLERLLNGELPAKKIRPEDREPLASLKKQIAKETTRLKLQQRLDDLNAGKLPEFAGRNKSETDAEIEDIKRQIKEHDLMQVVNMRKQLQRQIERLQKNLAENNIGPAVKTEPKRLDKETQKLKDQLIALQLEREKRLAKIELQNRPKWKKVADPILEPIRSVRTLLTSFDFSAPLRQGLVPTLAHPTMALKAAGEMFKQAFSQKAFDRWLYDLKESPEWRDMQDSKLYIADPEANPHLSAQEERFMGKLVEKIPVLGTWFVKGSERAYTAYLNKLRVDVFNQGADLLKSKGMYYDNAPHEYKSLATWINNATGRGGLGKAEPAAELLNTGLFAPRLIAARLNTMNPYFYYKLAPEIRAMALKDFSKFVGFTSTALGLLALSGAGVSLNPFSSDFMKARFGDTRYDLWGGYIQYITFMSRMLMGKTQAAGDSMPKPLDGKAGRKSRADLFLSFVRSKVAPVPGMMWDLAAGKDATGNEATFGNEFQNHYIPMIGQDVYDAWQTQGPMSLISTLIPSTFGVGVQSYHTNEPQFSKDELEDPHWQFLLNNNIPLPEVKPNQVKVFDENTSEERALTPDEFSQFTTLRKQYMEEQIGNLLDKGVTITDSDENEVSKNANELSQDELKLAIKNIEGRATRQAKEQMFGATGKPSGKKIRLNNDDNE